MKTVFNVLRCIVAAFLSIFLFGVLVGGGFASGASAFVQEEVITGVFSSLDGYELIHSDADLRLTLTEAGFDAEAVAELLNTQAVDDIIELYFNDIYAVVEGELDAVTFTEENVRKILDTHMEELKPIVNAVFQQPDDIPEEYLREQVYIFVEAIAESMPNVEALGIYGSTMTREDMETLKMLQMMHSGNLILPMLTGAGIMSLLILLCRYEKFEGFIWLSIAYFLSGGLLFGVGNVLQRNIPVDSTFTAMERLIMPAINMFGSKLFTVGIILVLIAVACLVVWIVGRKPKSRKNEVEMMVE